MESVLIEFKVNGDFETELRYLLNRYSKENDSNTPDFILAKYVQDCLSSLQTAVNRRDEFYGKK